MPGSISFVPTHRNPWRAPVSPKINTGSEYRESRIVPSSWHETASVLRPHPRASRSARAITWIFPLGITLGSMCPTFEEAEALDHFLSECHNYSLARAECFVGAHPSMSLAIYINSYVYPTGRRERRREMETHLRFLFQTGLNAPLLPNLLSSPSGLSPCTGNFQRPSRAQDLARVSSRRPCSPAFPTVLESNSTTEEVYRQPCNPTAQAPRNSPSPGTEAGPQSLDHLLGQRSTKHASRTI